jgi:hypothetical protein
MFKVVDNFFKKDQYDKMKNLIIHPDFSWYLLHGVTDAKNDDFFMLHTFFKEDCGVNSDWYPHIIDKQLVHGFHTDRKDKHMVVLFYFNDNNGYTLFKNRKVKSKDNRAVIFDGSLEHSSTTCTNQNYRITLNINYEF